ncbi:hypothetical protein SANTM175S_05730 [Streptomyces antimycoticus]
MTSSVRPSAVSSTRAWPPADHEEQRVVGWRHAAASHASSSRWCAARSMPLGAASVIGRSVAWSVQVVTVASNSPSEMGGLRT